MYLTQPHALFLPMFGDSCLSQRRSGNFLTPAHPRRPVAEGHTGARSGPEARSRSRSRSRSRRRARPALPRSAATRGQRCSCSSAARRAAAVRGAELRDRGSAKQSGDTGTAAAQQCRAPLPAPSTQLRGRERADQLASVPQILPVRMRGSAAESQL